ncbi:Sir2 family NAD-dependent protein deacetylase [Caulobacter sp. S45]|uniref:SIR2 family NAD-dependent protein deacylase n=1 Tax=Caulobacter sp. S45 TaxID=1641861 RepID=UPI0015762658|nr:Sir2 family NAD-dependent protein deacetylase [Caulobacter sp. S45]
MAPAGQLAAFLSEARRIVVFTGAGVSTESGIPDFRSPGGVWSRMKPITFQEFTRHRDKRREAWTRVFSGATGWTGREPNRGHLAIARLIHAGKASVVIAQNVDNLHQASGCPYDQVIELHGNASYATCLNCGMHYELGELRDAFLATSEPPACRRCGGWVKTATVSFGQAMPEAEMARAETETHACDLFLALGSSLQVYPAATFPILAKRNGARLAIVKRKRTELDNYADPVLNAEIGSTLSEAVDRCLGSAS